jgi:hypothetical protein
MGKHLRRIGRARCLSAPCGVAQLNGREVVAWDLESNSAAEATAMNHVAETVTRTRRFDHRCPHGCMGVLGPRRSRRVRGCRCLG